MPIALPSSLIAEKNKLYSVGSFLELLEIQLTENGTTLRLVNNNEDIIWGGYTWTAFLFFPGDFEESVEGENNTLDIRVSNVARVIEGYIETATNGLIGDTTIYRLISSENLTEQAALTATFQILAVECDDIWCSFTLGLENFFFKRFPLHQYRRNICRYETFKGEECGYVGAETTCDRLFYTCISYGNVIRFGGQPGIPGGLFSAE